MIMNTFNEMKNLLAELGRVVDDVKKNGIQSKYVVATEIHNPNTQENETIHYIDFYQAICDYSWESCNNDVDSRFANLINKNTFVYCEKYDSITMFHSNISIFKKNYYTQYIQREEFDDYEDFMVYFSMLLIRCYYYTIKRNTFDFGKFTDVIYETQNNTF